MANWPVSVPSQPSSSSSLWGSSCFPSSSSSNQTITPPPPPPLQEDASYRNFLLAVEDCKKRNIQNNIPPYLDLIRVLHWKLSEQPMCYSKQSNNPYPSIMEMIQTMHAAAQKTHLSEPVPTLFCAWKYPFHMMNWIMQHMPTVWKIYEAINTTSVRLFPKNAPALSLIPDFFFILRYQLCSPVWVKVMCINKCFRFQSPRFSNTKNVLSPRREIAQSMLRLQVYSCIINWLLDNSQHGVHCLSLSSSITMMHDH
jgi:hypothetical protein